MARFHRKAKVMSVMTAGVASVLLFFQNCAKDFEFEATELFYELEFFSNHDFRTESFNPTIDENRPEIELITIVDNSPSMRPIQQLVVSSFQSVGGQLKGFGGQARVLSTTQDGQGIRQSYRVESGVLVEDTSGQFSRQVASLAEVPADKSFRTFERKIGLVSLFEATKFDAKMSDEQFANFVSLYASSIERVIPSAMEVLGVEVDDVNLTLDQSLKIFGSEREQGFCTLLRDLERGKEPGKYYSYIIATDENDSSDIDSCLKEIRRDTKREGRVASTVDECEPGDANCVFDYEIELSRLKRLEGKFEERRITETFHYALNNPTYSSRLSVSYPRHRIEFQARAYRHRLDLKYDRATVRDGILFPLGTSGSRSLSTSVFGQCSFSERACSQSELGSIGEPFVEGSCKVECSSLSPQSFSGTLANNQLGTCSAASVPTSRSCSSSTVNQILTGQAGLSASHFESCQETCSNPTGIRVNNSAISALSPAINSCEDVGLTSPSLTSGRLTNPNRLNTVSRVCSQQELQQAVAASGLSSIESEVSCSMSCTQNRPSVLTRTSSPVCALSSQATRATEGAACGIAPEVEAAFVDVLAASRRGHSLDELAACNYRCGEGTASFNGRIVEAQSSCSVGEVRACSADELTAFNPDLTRLVPGSCEVSCREFGETLRKRLVSQTAYDLCDSSAGRAQILSALGSEAAGRDLLSCRRLEGRKSGSVLTFDSSVQPEVRVSLLGDSEQGAPVDKVNLLAQRLKQVHGDQFFIAGFLNTGSQVDCLSSSEALRNRVTDREQSTDYLQLFQKLGQNNARAFPVCLQDYSPALESIFETIVREVRRNYRVRLNAAKGEFINRMYLVKNGGDRIEVSPSQYTVDGDLLRFYSEDALIGVTEVIYEVAVPKVFGAQDRRGLASSKD